MHLELQDKVVFVAGSTRGIGLAIARRFLKEGARVIITGRDSKSLDDAKQSLIEWKSKLLVIECDLMREDEIQRALSITHAKFGEIDCLIANIGSGRGEGGIAPDPSEWQRLMDINLNASVRMISAVLPSMTRAKSGSIVIVNSIVGMESSPAPLPYSAAKAALPLMGLELTQWRPAMSCLLAVLGKSTWRRERLKWRNILRKKCRCRDSVHRRRLPMRSCFCVPPEPHSLRELASWLMADKIERNEFTGSLQFKEQMRPDNWRLRIARSSAC